MAPDQHAAIHRQIVAILHEHCGIQDPHVSLRARLQEDLGLDSMSLLTLALEIENHWQVYLAESPESPPQTLGDLVTLVAQRLREKAS